MKHYLIDSENVGDFWIPLLELPADRAELIVFYTKNSPHMSYDSLIKLKESDRKVTFIKCYEGTNALDFQLCSELGFLIAMNPGDDFIIVTNDTGYDAAVKYWRRKEYSVKRIAGKDSRTGGRRRGAAPRFDVAAEVSSILHKLVKMPDHEESDAEEEQAQTQERTEFEPEAPEYSETDPETEFEDDADELDYEDQEESDEEQDGESLEMIQEEAEEFSEEEAFGEDPEEFSEETDPEEITEVTDSEETAEETDPEDFSEQEDTDPEETAEQEEAGEGESAQADEAQSTDPEETDPAGEAADDAAQEIPAQDAALSESMRAQEPAGEEAKAAFTCDPQEITAIVNCIGMENLAELHNQLIQFYGDEGKDIYQSLKSGALSIEKKDWDREEKFLYYCALIFRHSDEPAQALSEENISEFAGFLLAAESKRKNLNSLRYALLKHYGKEKGRKYYFMLKPYVKALNQM